MGIRDFFQRGRKQPKEAESAACPPQYKVPDRYAVMTERECKRDFCAAIRDDDLDVLRAIARHHPESARWIAVAEGSSIGGMPISTPVIVLAAAQGRTRVLRWLLENGADLQARCNLLDATPLFHAARNAHAETVALLLAEGAAPQDGQRACGMADPVSPAEIARWSGFAEIACMIEGKAVKTPPPRPRPAQAAQYKLPRL